MAQLERYVDPRQVVADIRYLLAQFNGSNLAFLRCIGGMKVAMEIVGVRLWHKDAMGKRPHLLVGKWRDNLAVAGIQPDQLEMVDWGKLEAAIEKAQDCIEHHRRNRAKRKAQDTHAVCVPVKDKWTPVTQAQLLRLR